MTTITADLAASSSSALASSFTSPVPPPATLPGELTDYEVWATTKYGAARTRTMITTATVQGFLWPGVNAPASAQFQVPWDDPDVAQLPVSAVAFTSGSDELTHEVQIYRNGELLFWGPVIGRQGDAASRTWQYVANDPLWYLQGRYFGEANRRNYLTNSDYEDDAVGPGDPSGWNSIGGADLDVSIDGVEFLTGTRSLHLEDLTAGDNGYVGQILAITAGKEGLAVIATGWVFVEEIDPDHSESTGLNLLRVQPLTDVGLDSRNDPVDLATPSRQWTRKTCALLLPPNTTSLVEVRTYAVTGVCNWDAVTLTTEESLSLISLNSPGGLGWDQIDVAKMIVRYASGAYPIGSPYTKSNILLGTAGTASGVKKSRTYQFFDHQQIYQGGTGAGALDEFFTASDGFDVRCEVTERTRTAHFYYPAAGQTWADNAFIYQRTVDGEVVTGQSTQVVSHSWQETIQGQANRVVELGDWGDGAGREEGGGVVNNWGDLTLELVEAAPTGATLDLLNTIAAARAAQLGEISSVPTLTLAEMRDPTTGDILVPLVGRLLPGDLMPLVIDDGSVQVDETVRCTSVRLDATTELLTVTVQLNTPAADTVHAAPRVPPKQSQYTKRIDQRLYEIERRILKGQISID